VLIYSAATREKKKRAFAEEPQGGGVKDAERRKPFRSFEYYMLGPPSEKDQAEREKGVFLAERGAVCRHRART